MEKIYISHNKIFNMNLKFNGKDIPLYSFVEAYKKKQNNSLEMVEILPSIYCNAVLNTKIGWKKILHRIKVYFDEEDDYIIYIKNIRDSVSIEMEGEYDYLNKSAYSVKCGEDNTYVKTELLPYPSLLGGGCCIWSLFSAIELFTTCSESDVLYKPLSESQLLRITADISVLNENVCKNSVCCGEFINKMLDGTFVPIYADEDSYNAIKVVCVDGKMSLDEGKHRVCAAKRFGIEQIPATVYYYSNNETGDSYYQNTNSMRFWLGDIKKESLCNEILEECYRIYRNIGLSDNNIRELNETVTDDCFISFLEKMTGKSIMEILGLK